MITNGASDLPAKRAKNVKVGPIAGLKEDYQKLKDLYNMHKASKKVGKMLQDHQKYKSK
jgi:hypothetical protein